MAAKNNASSDDNGIRTPAEMARILCVSEMELRRLTSAGVLVRTIALHNKRQRVAYKWEDNVMRYIGHLRSGSLQSRDSYNEEKRLTQAIVRQQKELELAIARGDMVKRSRVVLVMTALLSTIKNHVLAIPSKCGRQLLGKKNIMEVRAVLDPACRDTLRETEDFGVHSFDETGKNGTQTNGENAGVARLRQRVKRRRRTS